MKYRFAKFIISYLDFLEMNASSYSTGISENTVEKELKPDELF